MAAQAPVNLDPLLHQAALQGEVALLQDLLQRDPLLVHRSSTCPLHVACKLGHAEFACELLRVNPTLAEELDPSDKSTPLHVASRYGHLGIVTTLVSISPNTCFARDMTGMNPVHTAAVKGHLHVLGELLREAPAAAREKVGPSGESILHLCVKHRQPEALRVVVNAVGDAEMINAADRAGSTALHVAVANKHVEMVRFLLSDGRTRRNAPNSQNLTAMDIFSQSHKDPNANHQLKLLLKRFKALQFEALKKENERHHHFVNWFESQRNALMIVASLIATMAFQAGLNPPGGSWQDASGNHKPGAPIMAQQNKRLYNVFLVSNTAGFVASMSGIILLISGLPCKRLFVVLVMVAMWLAIVAMEVAYGAALYALAPVGETNLVKKILLRGMGCLGLLILALILAGHLAWWTLKCLRQCGRLLFRRRTIASS